MKQEFNIPCAIYLYDEGIKGINFKSLRIFLEKNFGKIPFRLVRLKEKITKTDGLVFNLLKTSQALGKLKTAKIKDACHIILTDRLFATYDEARQVHIRAALFGFPSIISTSGIVEGPAKPKDYYIYKQKYTQLNIWGIEEARIKRKFQGRFIDYQDKRINEVIKGYISQALFFYITGEPFCKRKACRLYNAHWQEDLIYSQIKIRKFCNRHVRVLKEIRDCCK